MRRSICFIVATLVYCCIGILAPVHAETLNSDSYTIRLGNFNMTSGFKSSASYNLTDTVGQIAAEFFSSNGYHVKTGFQYIYTLYNFTFSISSLLVDLGELTPHTFARASHTLTVSAPGQGYSVSTYEVSPLKNQSGDIIADTTCDAGCSENQAGSWVKDTSYGFGYNASGDDVSSDFVSPSTFRPFPDLSHDESPATIMLTNQAGKNRTATITYQANVSTTQKGGEYATSIVYIATPVY